MIRLAIELGPEDNLIEDDEVYEVNLPTQSSTSVSGIGDSLEKDLNAEMSINNVTSQATNGKEQNDSLSSPQKITNDSTVEFKERVESAPKCVVWQTVDDDQENEIEKNNNTNKSNNQSILMESPETKKSDSLSSLERENIFSPHLVRKRSSSMKKAGGSTEISVVTRSGSHGHSFSAEDIPSTSSPRSPEFSFSARNRSQSERGMIPLRRLSSGARLEGAAKVAMAMAGLDAQISSPNNNIGASLSPLTMSNEIKTPVRRSSTHGSYVRSAISHSYCYFFELKV